MKLKKFVSGFVALALAATMAAPALAHPKPSTIGNDKLVSVTKLIDGTGYGSETISLSIENGGAPIDVKNSSLTTTTAADLKISIPTSEEAGVTIAQPTTGTTTTGTLHIQLPTYTKVGTYVYKFKEAAGTTAGMTYDTADKYLVVYVYEEVDTDGNLKDTQTLKINATVLDAYSSTGAIDQNHKIDNITNKYRNGKLVVTKNVKGNAGDRDKDFLFKVTFTKTAGTTVSGSIHVDYSDNTKQDVDLSTWGTGDTLTHTFNLSHKDNATFTNIPYGVSVSVVEMVDNETEVDSTTPKNGDYDVTYTVDQGDMTKPIGDNNCTFKVTITNKSTMNPDTGIILDNAPYIALLTIVAAGTVMMLIKKRRIED